MTAQAEKKANLEGALEEFPFPRLLQFLHERRATGRLVLRKGEITKVMTDVYGRYRDPGIY